MKINKAFNRGGGVYQGVLLAILVGGLAFRSGAQVTNLTAGSTSLQITLGGSLAGLSNWTIDGVNQLDYQWFYYSIGSSTLSSIDNVAPWTAPTLSGSQPNPILTETYDSSTLDVTTKYELEGVSSASGLASLATTITLQNLSTTNETLHLYQFSDFDLGNTLGNQTVQFAGIGSPYRVTQTILGGGLTGTLNAGLATVEEAAGVEDGNQLGLMTGNAAPPYNDSSLSATGQVDYAYEIDATLNPNQSIIISETQTVPEPSTLGLGLSGILVAGLVYGRKLDLFKKH